MTTPPSSQSKAVFDPATYLDDFVASMDNVPGEVQHILSELKDNDKKYQEAIQSAKKKQPTLRKYVLAETDNTEQEARLQDAILDKYTLAQSLAEEKIRLAHSLVDLVDRHIKKMDFDMHRARPTEWSHVVDDANDVSNTYLTTTEIGPIPDFEDVSLLVQGLATPIDRPRKRKSMALTDTPSRSSHSITSPGTMIATTPGTVAGVRRKRARHHHLEAPKPTILASPTMDSLLNPIHPAARHSSVTISPPNLSPPGLPLSPSFTSSSTVPITTTGLLKKPVGVTRVLPFTRVLDDEFRPESVVGTIADDDKLSDIDSPQIPGGMTYPMSRVVVRPQYTRTPPVTNLEDEDTKPYCYCQKPSFGDMIGCDNAKCPYEWFHLDCITLPVGPTPDTWYCPDCVEVVKSGNDTSTHKKRGK